MRASAAGADRKKPPVYRHQRNASTIKPHLVTQSPLSEVHGGVEALGAFTQIGSYVDNLPSTAYRPWQTVAYAEGERYATLITPGHSPTICDLVSCTI
jgi:hypothetical protein